MINLNKFQKFIVFLIDATVAFFIFQVIALVLSSIYFLPFFPGYWAIWAIYYIASYCCFRKTLGQSFFQAGIVVEGNITHLVVRIVLQESLTSLPAIIFWTTCWIPVVIKLSSIILLVCVILLIFRKKLFDLRIRRFDTRPKYKPCWIYLAIIVVGVLARFVNIAITADKEVLAKAPFNAEPRPSVNLVQKYVNFLNGNRQNINDYIMGLFNEYDHVILCERVHPEMTQYDMIYNLVTDKRFVDSVGVVFTEVGNVESRRAYRKFVNMSFENDTLIEKELTSFLMDNQTVWLLWTNTNWFNFLKKMYYFNHDRKNKVEIMFSDKNWIDRSQLDVRDSIMGANIISTVESDSIKKSLIIMNYRHAFLTQGNVGYYINRRFPGRVANVMINTPIVVKCMMPVQNGHWDVAIEQMHPVEFAFDFKESPFGEDSFDFVLMSNKIDVKYQDVFTGVIFYKSLNEQYVSTGFNYIFEPDNLKKIEERSRLLPKDAQISLESLKGGIYVRHSFDIFGVFVRIANTIIIGVIIFSLLLDGVMCLYTHYQRNPLSP